jgi:uncharacterized protein YhfF
LIFKPGLVEKILTGKKTMTRRPVKAGENVCLRSARSPRAPRYVPEAGQYVVGREYAVQKGRGGHEVARIKITGVRIERLGDITHDDAVAEGFKRTTDFFDYWERTHRRVDHDQLVWVLTFERVDVEPERYLGRRGGYTEQPQLALTSGEEHKRPPAAVPAGWQEKHSTDRRYAFEEERTKSLDQRVRDAIARAEEEGIDISRHRSALAKRVEALERELRKLQTRSRAA